MGWLNADYESQPTDALRLSKARAFLAELRGAIGAEVGAEGASRSTNTIMTLIADVKADVRRYERLTGESQHETSVIRADFGGGGHF